MKVLLLRTCNKDLTSYNGFKWLESGLVEAPDWNNREECGGGLHGLLWGEGDGGLLDWREEAKWLVFEADSRNVVNIDNHKSKAKKGKVVYCGNCKGATDYILAHNKTGRVLTVVGAMVTVGDNQTAIVGYNGTATASHRGTATAGEFGIATAGKYGTATAGHKGTATAGHKGTATAGNGGTAMAGDGGTAMAGDGGTAMAGYGGRIQIEWWDGSKYRLAVGYVGEDNIKPNKQYVVNKNGKLVIRRTK